MNNKKRLSEEQLDFLSEMMNIGAGNAATALAQMLAVGVEVKIPKVHLLPVAKVPSLLDDPVLPVACVRMGMVGDVVGDLLWIVPDEQKASLIHLVQGALPTPAKKDLSLDLSVLTEVGNILAGVYLTAIHDFCRLNIYPTVPTLATDMIQSLLDELLISLSREEQTSLMVENEFIVGETRIQNFLLIIPAVGSVKTLVDSIQGAMMG